MPERPSDAPMREPDGRSGRHAGDMSSSRHAPTDHVDHDPLLIVAHAAGDLDGADRDRAESLIASCAGCADLHRELLSITVAIARLPEPSRPRDFTLSREDAGRLRRPSLRRILVDLAGPRGILGRPLAATVTSLGVAGIVLASASGMFGQTAQFLGSVDDRLTEGQAGALQSGSPTVPVDGSLGPDAAVNVDGATAAPPGSESARDAARSHDVTSLGDSNNPGSSAGAAPSPAADAGQPDAKNARDMESASSTSPLVFISFALVALGLALFALRHVAGRLA